jgi:hypothetical protein
MAGTAAATTGGVRLSLALAVTAALVGGVAAALAARPRVAQVAPATAASDRLRAGVDRLVRERGQVAAERAALAAGYERQLRTIDGLKRQRASWRRDRQLRAEMSSSLDTARRLQAVTARLRDLDARLLRDRRQLLAAIDVELATPLPAARRQQLGQLRTSVRTALGPAPRKIVVPDEELDPLADPEELEQQAAALRDSERELAREVENLARQAARFRRMSELRQQNERAGDLALRDDEGPRRRQLSTSGRGSAIDDESDSGGDDGGEAPSPPSEPGPGAPPTDEPGGGTGQPPPLAGDPDDEPALVLSEIVDAPTLDALRRAQRSADPAAKAAAAELARRRVADRLRLLREKRAAIEKRARELRPR